MIVALILLVLGALLCLGLNRLLPTWITGLVAAGTALLAALVLVFGGLLPLDALSGLAGSAPGSDGPFAWAAQDGPAGIQMTWHLHLNAVSTILGITLLGGGALLLLALALTLAPGGRGNSSLFAWALLAQAAALLGLGSTGLLLPISWAAAALLGYSAVRASGALSHSEAPPYGLLPGLLASLLLMVGLLLAAPALSVGAVPESSALIFIALGTLMLAGGAPFHSALDEAVSAPAALGGLLYGLVLPLLALGTLLNLLASIRTLVPDQALPPDWQTLLPGLGLLSLLACSAGALSAHGLRRMLGWLAGAQVGVVLLAAPLAGELATLAAPSLLINLALTTLAGALAAAVLERLTGSDDYTALQTDEAPPVGDLWLPGLLWALAGASALGLPALWGFWGRRWLFEALVAHAPWAIPPLIIASLLAALAYLAPLARFWWQPTTSKTSALALPTLPAEASPLQPLLVIAPLLLVVPGLIPWLVWSPALPLLPGAPAALPVDGPALVGGGLIAGGGLVLALLLRQGSSRRALPDEDMAPVVLAPDALAGAVAPLALPGHPAPLLRGIWAVLLLLGERLQAVMTLFERRYYLAGVMLAVISLILLMAQG